jgi:ADP-ribosyl-[dinitrogen reductase] hydrolase
MDYDNTSNDAILNQAAGCLVGVAVGDALGGPAENLTAEEIHGSFGRITEMTGGGRMHLDPGETTDDTAQTIALAESIVSCGRLVPADVATRLAKWFKSGPKGVGGHTAAVLQKIVTGEDWEQASLEVQAATPGSAGNGSLMRCSPVALLHHGSAPQLIEDSRLSSRITHPHGECQWSCAFLNLVIADLLAGSQPRRAVDSSLALCAHRGDVAGAVLERASNAAAPGGRNLTASGYVLDTLECSLWSLLNHDSFEDTLAAAVNLGGDADTIGAVTGPLGGAAYGLHAIPDRWLVHIRSWWRLQELAVALTEINQ